MERFDIHKWKPTECRKVEEIEAALRKFNAIGKKIISLRAIGAAANLNYWEDCYEIDKAIKKAEKQCDKHILAPLRADIFEPVIFTFEDGSTLEILSKGEGKLLIASNQIPHGITEGLNHSNFDSEWLFRKIKNSALTGQVSLKENNGCSDYFYFDMIEYG
ncbi:MAG: hypothetical protein J5706_09340, partial [Elusimicrobiales bacterium]|nr:hypothetical protein [Elusimicrobiales bacterium]